VLCCAVLCCAVLCCAVLCCAALTVAWHACRDAFDAVYGASAGALNATYFLSGQREGVNIYHEHIATPEVSAGVAR
jgi:hypothetical protein